MGFINTATTLTVTAKLTPLGRQRLVSNNNSLITSFSLGDSDSNYYATLALTTGQIPSEGGDLGPLSANTNSTTGNFDIKSSLILNQNGVTLKSVEPNSINILSEVSALGYTTISGSSLSQVKIDRNNYITDSLVNLFYSFGLPLNSSQDTTFTSTTYTNGGFSDTSVSGLAKTNIVVIGIKNSLFGELIDGKSIKLVLPTTGGTYSIYSTFQNTGESSASMDVALTDLAINTNQFGQNIAFLFSDTIKTPNGGSGSLSWGTGYGTVKPFSLNGKQKYNFQTESNTSTTADTLVGIVYLDKGLIVLTDPTIIANYGTTCTGATLTFDSVATSVYQSITCIAGRGEFGSSTNSTFSNGNIPRISEIGLYDNLGNLIAVGKTDRHVTKNINQFLAFGVNIQL